MEKGVHDSKSKIEQVIVADTERSNDSPLDDKNIEASQRLLHRQFPQFKGLQPTLYSQALHKFQEHPEGSDSIQIHHTGSLGY